MQNGVTGFLVNSADEMVAAVGRLDEIDPRTCRGHMERLFDAHVMADGYLRVYESVLDRRPAGPPGAALSSMTPVLAARLTAGTRPAPVA